MRINDTDPSSLSDKPPAAPPQMAERLMAMSVLSTRLMEAMELDRATAVTMDWRQRAERLGPHVQQFKDANRSTAEALSRMSVAELRVDKKLVKKQLLQWTTEAEVLHEQCKAQFGETHATTVAALQARAGAATAFAKASMRVMIAHGARKLGVMSEPRLSGPAMRLLAPHVEQFKNASKIAAEAARKMPVAELRANAQLVKEQLTQWANEAGTLHKQCKARFGQAHPVTAVALKARTEASVAYCKTMLRMAVANVANKIYDSTVGKVIGALRRMFGSGG